MRTKLLPTRTQVTMLPIRTQVTMMIRSDTTQPGRDHINRGQYLFGIPPLCCIVPSFGHKKRVVQNEWQCCHRSLRHRKTPLHNLFVVVRALACALMSIECRATCCSSRPYLAESRDYFLFSFYHQRSAYTICSFARIVACFVLSIIWS